MSKFFDKEDIGNSKLPRMLIRMKEEERKHNASIEFSEKNNNNLPIDVVLNDIHRYYRREGLQHLENISRLFVIDELSDQIVKLLKNGCNQVLKNNKLEDHIYSSFDDLIRTHIEEKK